MISLARCLPALAVVALLAAPAGAQQLYKYTGPDGRVQYTDRPPAGVQNVEKVTGARVSTVGPAGSAAAGSREGAKSEGPKTAADQEQAFRQRRAEAEEKAKKDEKLAQQKRASDEQCNALRRELAAMQSGQRIARLDEKGERVFLEDAQIQQDAARLQRDIAANCK